MQYVSDIDSPSTLVPLSEKAPDSPEAEAWVLANKERFKKRYGANYEKFLYGKAWELFKKDTVKTETSHTVDIQFTKDGEKKITQTTVQGGMGDLQTFSMDPASVAIDLGLDAVELDEFARGYMQ